MRAILIAATLLVAGAATAFPEPVAPLVDHEAFTEDGSVAWRMFLPAGSFVSFWMGGTYEEMPFGSFSLWFVDPVTYEFSAMFNPTWFPEGGSEMHVEGDLVGEVSSTIVGSARWPLEMRVDFEPNSDREWLFVVTHAFDGDVSGEWKLFADRGATLLGSTRADAFLHTERDFEGAANVVVREDLPVREAMVEAKAQVATSVPERVEGRMFAVFWGGDHADLQRISLATPTGTEDGHDWYMVHGGPAGEYAFRIDQNVDWHDNQPTCRALNGEQCWRMPAWATGADIVPP